MSIRMRLPATHEIRISHFPVLSLPQESGNAQAHYNMVTTEWHHITRAGVSVTFLHQTCSDTRAGASPARTRYDCADHFDQGTGGACPRPGYTRISASSC